MCKYLKWNQTLVFRYQKCWFYFSGKSGNTTFPKVHFYSQPDQKQKKQLCSWTLRMVAQAWQHNFSVTSSRTPDSARELDSLPSGGIGDRVLLPSTLCRWAWGVRTTGVKCSLALANTYRCSTNISLGSLLSNRQSLWTGFQVCRNWVFDLVSDGKMKECWAECKNATFFYEKYFLLKKNLWYMIHFIYDLW